MPEKDRKNYFRFIRILPYIIGALLFIILLRLIRDGFNIKNITEILIELGLLAALIFVYTIGYIIVRIYEKLEKRRNA